MSGQAQCWFCYVFDIFVIWLHRTENGLHKNIQFTTEMDTDTKQPLFS
jgi:hypothetical protein